MRERSIKEGESEMKKSILLSLALSAATLASTPLLAQSEDSGAPAAPTSTETSGFHGPFGHMFKKLGLSDDQKQQIQTIRQKYQPQMKALEQQLSTEREALGQLMAARAPADQAQAQHKKVQSLVNQLDDQRFQMFY